MMVRGRQKAGIGGEVLMTDNKTETATFGGSLVADVLEFRPESISAPDTLHIHMKRGEKRIAEELHRQFGSFKRVVIDVDGERHEFSADSLIRLLEWIEESDGGLMADVLAPICVDEKERRAFERGRVHERFAQQIFKEATS